ncbi:glycoside hydrolase family 79 protein [Roridomyces roridus]|uniref:Glycoside hydrolase family 79 protein n=1 Tax=Roridomyces roridus TaxID=1738132 RepID=A0AAD7CIG6_9AGAR|nr:glycoside hydrolase family 79 protein [Roridomyces roridus]
MRPSHFFFFTVLQLGASVARASVTVYGQQRFGDQLKSLVSSTTSSAAAASYTGSAAYNPTVLNAPPVPNPPPPTKFFQQLSSAPVPGLSIPQSGNFYGLSVEFSVANQLINMYSTRLAVPFLNSLANLQARGGSVRVRVGGNTQDYATMVPSLPNGTMFLKETLDPAVSTTTPPVLFTPDFLYMLANISALVNVEWYLGIPLNDTSNLRLQIAEAAESILGDKLIGFQVGNEPDEYAEHGHRPLTYGPADYSADFGTVDAALRADPNVPVVNKKLIGPSLSGRWQPQEVWDVNFIPDHLPSLAALSMQFYPENNCVAQTNGSNAPGAVNPQDVFPTYLNHTSGQAIAAKYLNRRVMTTFSTVLAQTFNLPFIMLETNSASCGGFVGVSNSFGSALWALDYGLQLAYSNFSNAFLHIGGQGEYYNVPPPGNQTSFREWTVGPVFYSIMGVAETFGNSNKSRIIDLQMNGNNEFTPGYAVYDGDVLARLALFNYVTDPSGASEITVSFAIGGGATGQANGTPAQVKVKYLLAPSVSSLNNITWAGQTFGPSLSSDGRPTGNETIQTVTCNTNNTCDVTIPAPGFALVFLTDIPGDSESFDAVETFSTTTLRSKTQTQSTATVVVNPSVLATANGQPGTNFVDASTSKGKAKTAAAVQFLPHLTVAICVALGVVSMMW